MSDVLQSLISARQLISDPAKWGKGMRGVGKARPLRTYCAAEAIEEVTKLDQLRQSVYFRVAQAIHPHLTMVTWNDAPERTHEEVLAAFDRAIELEKKHTGEL